MFALCDLTLKGLAHADLAKKRFFCMNFYCFICDYYVALLFALVLLKYGYLKDKSKVWDDFWHDFR